MRTYSLRLAQIAISLKNRLVERTASLPDCYLHQWIEVGRQQNLAKLRAEAREKLAYCYGSGVQVPSRRIRLKRPARSLHGSRVTEVDGGCYCCLFT